MTKLFNRQKILLGLLQGFGGKVNNVNFQKYLFLFTQNCQSEPSYDFVPYKFGCFSFQSYADKRKLVERELLTTDDNWVIANDVNYLNQLPPGESSKINKFCQKYAGIYGKNLVREVYREFPYYAIKSEISEKLMSKQELENITQHVPTQRDSVLFTIGYEGSTLENYLNRLIKNNVKTLVDVRKNPLSRKYGFSKKTLSETIRKLGMEYIHMPDLGIISQKRNNLKTQSDYNTLFDEYERTVLRQNETALNSLLGLVEDDKRVAITCFEEKACMCHRGRVAKALVQLPNWNYEIDHI